MAPKANTHWLMTYGYSPKPGGRAPSPPFPKDPTVLTPEQLHRLKVLYALREGLEREQWDSRTAEGLAKETGIDVSEVRTWLEAHPEYVRKSVMRSQDGEDLYTAKERKPKMRERIAEVIAAHKL